MSKKTSKKAMKRPEVEPEIKIQPPSSTGKINPIKTFLITSSSISHFLLVVLLN